MKIYLSQKKKIFLGRYLATKHAVAFIINFIPKEEASWEIRFPNLLLPAVVYIDPRKIRLMGSVPAKPSKGCSFILDGNWDQQIVTPKESEIANPKHKSCREIIILKMALRETAEYHMIVEKIAVSGQYRECKN